MIELYINFPCLCKEGPDDRLWPLFQGVRFDIDATAISLSRMIMLLYCRRRPFFAHVMVPVGLPRTNVGFRATAERANNAHQQALRTAVRRQNSLYDSLYNSFDSSLLYAGLLTSPMATRSGATGGGTGSHSP